MDPSTAKIIEERGLHDAFEIGISLKGLLGIAELVGGFFLLFAPPETVQNIFLFFARGELLEDPKDPIVTYLLHSIKGFSAQTIFYAWLFILHGIVKVVLIAGLFKRQLWAYPTSIAAFSLFVAYQIYQLTFGYSTLLLLITIVDAAVIALTAHEYGEVKKNGFAYYRAKS